MRCSRSAAAAARCCSIDWTRRSRSAKSRSMRWKAASAPRRRSSKPANSAVICAASCCSASRFWRRTSSCACCTFKLLSACACSASRRAALLALLSDRLPLGLARVLVARGLRSPLLQTALDALRLGFHLLERRAQIRRLALRLAPLLAAGSPVAPSASSIAPLSASASLCACVSSVSSFASRPSVSRSSRFSASGPSLAGLPPVTVERWKHSPSGVRK